LGVFFVVDQVATFSYIFDLLSTLFFIANQATSSFLHILGLLGTMFLFLIKLQQVFKHPWASKHYVFFVVQVTTNFYTSLGFWAPCFYR
jgi:hypothetical protein